MFLVPGELEHPFTVTTSEYVPAAAAVTLGIEVFCVDAVNPLGPVHEYDAPATAVEVSVSVLPTHTGLAPFATGVAGIGLTVTAVVATTLEHPFTVAVTEKVPVANVVGEETDGFCRADVKPLGPVHV